MERIGHLPLSRRGVEGVSPPCGSALFFLCSSICTCEIGINCSEMLLPVNSVWNFVAFAHLCYLKSVQRFCVEGDARVRVRVSRVVTASLRLYLKFEGASLAAAKQLV